MDPRALARFRFTGETAAVVVRLPFGVLAARTVERARSGEPVDLTLGAADVLAWLDDEGHDEPAPRDVEWRAGLPPLRGWQRIETVPDDVIRPLVRSGALALKAAEEREGVPGAQPRAEVADALLDSVVLRVSDDAGTSVDVTLRAVSALTRMGFLRRGGVAHVDVAGRWIRLAAEYGSVFLERPGQSLQLG
jgi:hypothetical protein